MSYYLGYDDVDRIINTARAEPLVESEVRAELQWLVDDAYQDGEDNAWMSHSDEWAFAAVTDGELDDAVVVRAEKIGYVMPAEPGTDLQQELHLSKGHHKDGPIGWEYCARC